MYYEFTTFDGVDWSIPCVLIDTRSRPVNFTSASQLTKMLERQERWESDNIWTIGDEVYRDCRDYRGWYIERYQPLIIEGSF